MSTVGTSLRDKFIDAGILPPHNKSPENAIIRVESRDRVSDRSSCTGVQLPYGLGNPVTDKILKHIFTSDDEARDFVDKYMKGQEATRVGLLKALYEVGNASDQTREYYLSKIRALTTLPLRDPTRDYETVAKLIEQIESGQPVDVNRSNIPSTLTPIELREIEIDNNELNDLWVHLNPDEIITDHYLVYATGSNESAGFFKSVVLHDEQTSRINLLQILLTNATRGKNQQKNWGKNWEVIRRMLSLEYTDPETVYCYARSILRVYKGFSPTITTEKDDSGTSLGNLIKDALSNGDNGDLRRSKRPVYEPKRNVNLFDKIGSYISADDVAMVLNGSTNDVATLVRMGRISTFGEDFSGESVARLLLDREQFDTLRQYGFTGTDDEIRSYVDGGWRESRQSELGETNDLLDRVYDLVKSKGDDGVRAKELEADLEVSSATISKQLRALTDSGKLFREKDGNAFVYKAVGE